MQSVIIIPARYGSTRFPGKPLAKILDRTLLERTWLIAKAVQGIDQVFVATDDERIVSHTKEFGGEAIMTPPCENGTERALAALKSRRLKPEIVINFQGDAVLTPPAVIQPIVDVLRADATIDIATPATRMQIDHYQELCKQKQAGNAGGTLVTFDKNGRALYFSKSIIPYIRNIDQFLNRPASEFPVFRHIGLYGYRYAALERYVTLPASPLELSEGLEQLRALENGMFMRVVEVSYNNRTHWSVDSPDDAKLVEQIIMREGELVIEDKEKTCRT
jgi:3-deoxy-manno-octulosonate cytidylyltransferase (CMP-KDO synthetase)